MEYLHSAKNTSFDSLLQLEHHGDFDSFINYNNISHSKTAYNPIPRLSSYHILEKGRYFKKRNRRSILYGIEEAIIGADCSFWFNPDETYWECQTNDLENIFTVCVFEEEHNNYIIEVRRMSGCSINQFSIFTILRNLIL